MTILAIDDDVEDLEFFKEVVSCIDSSIRCISMNDCSEALVFLRNIIPDVIFLDINMPKMTGIECLSMMSQMEDIKNIPVVLFSTAFSPDINDLLMRPNTKFISKKSSLKESISAITSVLNELNLLGVS